MQKRWWIFWFLLKLLMILDQNLLAFILNFLPTWGFSEVYSGFGAELNGFIPQKGDIAVIAGTSEKQHGHIQIYDGSKY